MGTAEHSIRLANPECLLAVDFNKQGRTATGVSPRHVQQFGLSRLESAIAARVGLFQRWRQWICTLEAHTATVPLDQMPCGRLRTL